MTKTRLTLVQQMKGWRAYSQDRRLRAMCDVVCVYVVLVCTLCLVSSQDEDFSDHRRSARWTNSPVRHMGKEKANERTEPGVRSVAWRLGLTQDPSSPHSLGQDRKVSTTETAMIGSSSQGTSDLPRMESQRGRVGEGCERVEWRDLRGLEGGILEGLRGHLTGFSQGQAGGLTRSTQRSNQLKEASNRVKDWILPGQASEGSI